MEKDGSTMIFVALAGLVVLILVMQNQQPTNITVNSTSGGSGGGGGLASGLGSILGLVGL